MSTDVHIRKVPGEPIQIKTEKPMKGVTMSVTKLVVIVAVAVATGFCFGFANGMELGMLR